MPDVTSPIATLRNSHHRLTGLLEPLSKDQLETTSYATEWSIAQVASHLGSQAEIFELFLTAGLVGQPIPGGEVYQPIWDRWNGMPPAEQAVQCIRFNDAFVSRLEKLPDDQRDRFKVNLFGSDQGLDGLIAAKLGEHAVHTWDIAVVLNPGATISADAVEYLIDVAPANAGRFGKPAEGAHPTLVVTTEPDRRFKLTLDPKVSLVPENGEDTEHEPLLLPAEALIRLLYGRLDAEHTPSTVTDPRVDFLRKVFPGF